MSDEKGEAVDDAVVFKIDGEDVRGKPGQTVLEAGLDNGVFVPHYCWHPALSIAGNCRMCLVHMKGAPKPVIACQTQIREGMEIEAYTEPAKDTREGVMEFLLANHPLDCPVCDQAGECDLQEYSFMHGRGESRFNEHKTQRPNKDFGELVRFNGNRCIVCTRCVRFTEEISGTDELMTVNRGDRNHIDIFPGIPLDNPMSLCTTDLCPVGALLDRDFIHKSRVWNLTTTKSTCAGCATGCNMNVQTWNDRVQRLVPRENQCVNRWWMCDEGRLLYHETESDDRRTAITQLADKGDARETVSFEAAMTLLSENWRGAKNSGGKDDAAGAIGVIATGWHTNEELYTILSLLRGEKSPKLGADDLPLAVCYEADGDEWEAKDGFRIEADKNPNRAGVKAIFGKAFGEGRAPGLEALQKRMEKGELKLLVVLDGLHRTGIELGEGFLKALKKVPYVVSFDVREDGPLADRAHLCLPAATWLEKDGTFVNVSGRVQRVRPGVPPRGATRWDAEVLQELTRRLGISARALSAASVFRRLSEAGGENPFKGLGYNDLGETGKMLGGAADETEPRTAYGAGPVSRVRYEDRSVAEMIRVSVHRGG